MSATVRAAFGTSSSLHSTWTIIGVASFLIWGIPMSITIAGMFAREWRREEFGRWQRLGRGVAWFALYLLTLVCRESVQRVHHDTWLVTVLLFVASLAPSWMFWSLSPVVLVRDGGRGARFLIIAGLVGVVINGLAISPTADRCRVPDRRAGPRLITRGGSDLSRALARCRIDQSADRVVHLGERCRERPGGWSSLSVEFEGGCGFLLDVDPGVAGDVDDDLMDRPAGECPR